MQGTVTLAPASDPGFDLSVNLDAFQGMDRRDVTGRLSGDFRVEGSYRRPVVSGDLRVDEGTLFVEEFQRAARIVDLSDPAFYWKSFGRRIDWIWSTLCNTSIFWENINLACKSFELIFYAYYFR